MFGAITMDQIDSLLRAEEEANHKKALEAIETANKERQKLEMERLERQYKVLFDEIKNSLNESWKKWKESYPKARKADSLVFQSWLKSQPFFADLKNRGHRPRLQTNAVSKKIEFQFTTEPWIYTWDGCLPLEEIIVK